MVERATAGRATAGRVTRLAVLGSPIAHSKSPVLHMAAYRVLDLSWSYERLQLDAVQLDQFMATAGPEWRGVSLTMPLKERALQLADHADDTAILTGAVNTILFSNDTHQPEQPVAGSLTSGLSQQSRLLGFNSDVAGITRALADIAITRLEYVWLLGAGATAHSSLVAVAELGVRRVVVVARSPERAAALVALGRHLGIAVAVRERPETRDVAPTAPTAPPKLVAPTMAAAQRKRATPIELPELPDLPDLVISTLPGGARLPWSFSAEVREHSVLLDVAYDPWPSSLAASWSEVDGVVVSGLEMLIHQALVQVRIFVSGDPVLALPDELSVLTAMRNAVTEATM